MMLFLSVLTAFLFGLLLLLRVFPERERPALLIAVMALPAGWSLTSVMYFFWIAVSGGRSRWYPAIEILLLLCFIAVSVKGGFAGRQSLPGLRRWLPGVRRSHLLAVLSLLVAASLCLAISVKLAAVNPWGYWDAWARDNVKARFLAGGGPFWTWIFESRGIPVHDYPLLMPSTIARSWSWIGSITQSSPQVLTIVWAVTSFLTLFCVVDWLCATMTAVIAALAFFTFTPFLFWASAGYADIPLSFYMVSALAMMVAAERFPESRARFALLAGFFAGSAAWTKNEGLAFLFAMALWWAPLVLRRWTAGGWRAVRALGAGTAVGLSAVVVVKGGFAGSTGAVPDAQGTGATFPELLLSGERHLVILGQFAGSVGDYYLLLPLALLVAAFLLRVRWQSPLTPYWRPLAAAMTMAVIYYGAFLTTSLDLAFHVGSAMDRLMLQLWPLFLFSVAVLVNVSEEG